MMSQRTRILWIIFIAVLPLVAFAVLGLRREVEEGEAQVAQERVALARAAALATEAFIDGNLATVRTLAAAPVVTGLSTDADVSTFLNRALAENGDWEGVAIVNGEGSTLFSTSPASPFLSIADRPYFQQVMASRRPFVSSAITGRVSGLPSVVLAAPVDFASGARGVLVVPVPTDRLHAALRSQIGTESLQVTVVDRDGSTIADRDPNRMRNLAPIRGRPDVDAALTGAIGTQRIELDGADTLVAYAPVSNNGAVLIVEAAGTALAPVRSGLVQDIGLLLLALVVVVALGWYLAGRLSTTYSHLIEARLDADAARMEAERARQGAVFLAEASRELASSLDYEATLASVARLAVPDIADWCAVDVVDAGGNIRRLDVVHADPSKIELANDLARRYPTDPNASRAITDGRPQLIAEIPDVLLEAAATDQEHLRILRGLGLKSAMAVPLMARGRTLGALTFVSAESSRTYTEADLRFAQNLADRAALAVDNARLNRDLQTALKARDEFLAAVSHDIRNPLASIKATAQLLLLRLGRDEMPETDRLKDGLGMIDKSTNHVAEVVNGLLDLAHLEFGRPLELDRRPTDLAELAREVVAEFGQTSKVHRIHVDAADGVVGEWDAERLERVINNLLDNAVKYSPDGGLIAVTVQRGGGADGTAVLVVADEGLGIPESDLSRIFERFQRGSNVAGRIPGTGVGLASARQIVEQHAGTIAVDSQVGHGTTVTVRLPLSAPARDGDMPWEGPASQARA